MCLNATDCIISLGLRISPEVRNTAYLSISDSPTELVRNGQPAKVEDQIILQQVQKHQIFGTGHHSVLNVPGTDEWYMVYHRFTRPEGVKMGLSGGYNREVCIDKMEFNEDGTINPVIPTL